MREKLVRAFAAAASDSTNEEFHGVMRSAWIVASALKLPPKRFTDDIRRAIGAKA